MCINNPLHREAFEYYYILGESRTYKQVAEHFSKTEGTVKKWANKYNWSDMIAQRALENAKKAGIEALRAEITAVKAEYRGQLTVLLERACNDIKEGKLKVESVEDIETLIKLSLLLMGEPTESIELV